MQCVCVICKAPENDNDKLRNPNSGREKIEEYGKLYNRSDILIYLDTVSKDDIRIHVSCQKKIGNEIRKKLREDKDEEPSSKMKRRSDSELFAYSMHCLFCGKDAVENEMVKHIQRKVSSVSYPESADKKCHGPI